jgi:hypothetical protein
MWSGNNTSPQPRDVSTEKGHTKHSLLTISYEELWSLVLLLDVVGKTLHHFPGIQKLNF